MDFATPDFAAIVRVRELWYDDGNIILVAGRSSFRVHRSILSQYSSIFRDRFTVPQPPSVQDDPPVITLPDNSMHLKYTLNAIYHITYLDSMKQSDEIAPIAIGIASLAHKYSIEPLFDRAVSCLKDIYPTTLAQLDTMLHHFPRYRMKDRRSRSAHTISLINLVRRLQPSPLDPFLSLAFYLCTQLSSEMLVNGLLLPDGTCERLSPDDLMMCIDAKAGLTNCDHFTLCNISRKVKCLEWCSQNMIQHCRQALLYLAEVGDRKVTTNPLLTTAVLLKLIGGNRTLCKQCRDRVTNIVMQEHTANWQALHDVFDLPIQDAN